MDEPGFIGAVSKARVLMFIRCLAETFSEIIDPPHVPTPSVIEGVSAVVNPTAPKELGVLTTILNAGFSNANFIITSLSFEWITIVCPIPPNSKRLIHLWHPSSQPSTV